MNQPPMSLGDALGPLLVRLSRGGSARLLRATVDLLSTEREQGHVCVSLRDWQRRTLPGHEPFPVAADWARELSATGLCGPGDGETATPLVLRADDRLYLRRHFAVERRIVDFVRARLAAPPLATAADLRPALDAIGWRATAGALDWQLAAAVAIAHRSFAVLCGGPGTGKTTTVARTLGLLLRLRPDQRIAIAAPTGKAAARLGEALRAQAADGSGVRDIQPQTLHRLLGYLPQDDAFRKGGGERLPFDIVVVDEASMIDPAILATLCDALRPDSRLLLVGDQDQLAAIAAGQVLGELCRLARPELGVGAELAHTVHAATGMALPVRPDAPGIGNATVLLRDNHRFGQQPGIGGFATALASRAPERALATLRDGNADLRLVRDPDAALAAIADAVLASASATEPAEALRRIAAVRILCASRHGPNGTEAWNRRVEAMLARRGFRVENPFHAGRPILILANDHQNHVWNGDLGVVHPDADGRPHVWFTRPDGSPRPLPPSRLPPHETAWAITVHKAQGSEFDTVLVSMPDKPGPSWHASMLYTAVTRARRLAVVLADPALLPAALANWPLRSSGLATELARP